MRILIPFTFIIGLLLPFANVANDDPASLSQIIANFKAGESIIDKKIMLTGVNFAEEESRLTTEGRQQLDLISQQLRKIPTVAFEIISHTDKQSEKNAGRDLTRKRAKNVSDYLILQGIPYQRVFYTGMGAKELLSKKSSERARNNRIELRITGLKKGNHQIVTQTGEPLSAAVVIIGEQQVFYRNSESGRNQSIPKNQVERVDFSYGKSLNINLLPNKKTEIATVDTKTQTSPSTPNTLQSKTAKPPVKKISVADAPKIATARSTEVEKNKTPKKIVAPTPTPQINKAKKQATTPSSPAATTITATTPSPPLVKNESTPQATIQDTPQSTQKSTSNTIAAPTNLRPPSSSTTNTPIAANPNAPQVGSPITTTTPTTPKTEISTPNPTPSTPVLSENPVPLDPPTRPTESVTIADEATVEALLTRYLDNYLLQPRELPKIAPTAEELFNLNGQTTSINTDFTTTSTGVNSLTSSSSTSDGDKATSFTSVAENRSGWVFQIIRQPLGVEGVNLRMDYVDASEREVRIIQNKTLPDLSHLWLGSVGFMYHSDNNLSYQLAYNFGSKEDIRYQALSLGMAYRLAAGRLSVLPSAKVEYGAGRFNIATHELRTNIFTVKNTEFISETVDIDYRENLTTVTPQLGISYAINNKFDLLVQGGYSVNVLTIGKLRFAGGTENKENKKVREKLDNAGLSINGTPTIESANLFGVRGVAVQAGIVWKLY